MGSRTPRRAPPAPQAVPLVRYKGTNWSVVVSGGYERKSTEKPRRIYEQRVDCEPNCRDLRRSAPRRPSGGAFLPPDEREDVSVSIRGANTLKLTFLQIKDVTEFGDVNDAAPLFVPPGARLVSATARVSPRGGRRRQRRQVVLHLRLDRPRESS